MWYGHRCWYLTTTVTCAHHRITWHLAQGWADKRLSMKLLNEWILSSHLNYHFITVSKPPPGWVMQGFSCLGHPEKSDMGRPQLDWPSKDPGPLSPSGAGRRSGVLASSQPAWPLLPGPSCLFGKSKTFLFKGRRCSGFLWRYKIHMHEHACTHVHICTCTGTTSMHTHIRTHSKAQKPQ